MIKISVIVPCYRCGNYFENNFEQLLLLENNFEEKIIFEYVLIDDGSDDDTWEILSLIQKKYHEKVKIVQLARNFGAYNAVLAGLYYGEGSCYVAIAADLQEPPELIAEMFKLWKNQYKMVLGKRKSIDNPPITRLTSWIFHRLVKFFLLKNAPDKGFDFFLIDKIVRDSLLRLSERNANLLYLMIWMGYPYAMVEYDKKRRSFGKSQWTSVKKIRLFFDTFFAFSILPLRLLGGLGFLMLFVCFPFLIQDILFLETETLNFVSKLVLVIGGFILIGINVLGEYVWRISDEVKGRPIFLVNEFLDIKEEVEPLRTKVGFNFKEKQNDE